MIREDIENLNFNELNELEKREYATIMTLNARKLSLQLMNAGHLDLASLISIATHLAIASPAKLAELSQYASKLYEVFQIEMQISDRSQQILNSQQIEAKKETEDEFPPLDTDKEN
jgi:hypothetical protein